MEKKQIISFKSGPVKGRISEKPLYLASVDLKALNPVRKGNYSGGNHPERSGGMDHHQAMTERPKTAMIAG